MLWSWCDHLPFYFSGFDFSAARLCTVGESGESNSCNECCQLHANANLKLSGKSITNVISYNGGCARFFCHIMYLNRLLRLVHLTLSLFVVCSQDSHTFQLFSHSDMVKLLQMLQMSKHLFCFCFGARLGLRSQWNQLWTWKHDSKHVLVPMHWASRHGLLLPQE